MFSIITICKDDLIGLKKTCESLRAQTNVKFDWIVIDAVSIDGTVDYLINSDIKFLKYWLSEPDAGIYDAMNKGARFIRQDYVIYLNAGDILNDNFLTIAAGKIKKLKSDILFFSYNLDLPNGATIHKEPRDFASYIWHGMPTSHQAMIFSSSLIMGIPYDTKYKISGDYYLLAKAFECGFTADVNLDCMSTFQVGGASFQSPKTLIFEAWKIRREVLNVGLRLCIVSFLKSCISILGLRILSINIFKFYFGRHIK
tara:strand:+ start:1042 stop:1809 length:768 start_codon:yes stop_codon:yes gene_type:complete